MMKRITLAVVLCLVVAAAARAGEQARPMVFLTSLDVVQSMAEALTRDTSIEIVNVIPAGYSMQGQGAYLKKYQKRFFGDAARADGVLSVGAAWPGDPLYQWARRGNIRIVNIDVTKPLDGYGAGVPLQENDDTSSPFVWRSPANLTRMAVIAADDMCRMAPTEAETIKHNLKVLQSELFKLRSRYEGAFVDLDFVDLAALTADYGYLVDEFGLDTHFVFSKPEREWAQQDVHTFSARLRRNGVKGVICPWDPDETARTAIIDGGATPVVLKRFVRREGTEPVTALVEWYDENLIRLFQALQTH